MILLTDDLHNDVISAINVTHCRTIHYDYKCKEDRKYPYIV
jgi:hypothetical protein